MKKSDSENASPFFSSFFASFTRSSLGSRLITALCRSGSVRPRNSSAFASRYASTVPWKSRWSDVRFVNTATSKSTQSTRPCARAWLETSIAVAVAPLSSMPAISCWHCSASGVVFGTSYLPSYGASHPGAVHSLFSVGSASSGSQTPPCGVRRWSSRTYPVVPITPHLPSFASMMARTKKLVVVLPFVPVMPTVTSDALGLP